MDGKSGSSGAEVLKDVFARDRREEERERLAQQEEHRKKLLGKLTDPSQVEDLDPAQVIINEHTDGAILDLNSADILPEATSDISPRGIKRSLSPDTDDGNMGAQTSMVDKMKVKLIHGVSGPTIAPEQDSVLLAPRSPSQKKHKCPYCETEFTRHQDLKSHLLTHRQEKPYVCQTCSMRFRRLHDLKRHMKLHTGERPHICPKCNRKFARGDALERHSKVLGGCAGRRASIGSFGSNDNYEGSNAGDGDDIGMGGVLLSPLISNSSTNIIEANSVQDHTIGQLCPEGDEYITREHDDAGEEKVTPTGQLNGGREYLCQAFLVLNRGNKLFMLATECAKVLGYRDSYLLFTENRDLYEIIASYEEKEGLMEREILPYLSVGRQIAIVTAKSMFRQFGSKMIVNGRRVRDDYWESKGSEQGFTEEILPGEKKAVVMDLGEATKAEIPGPSNQYLTQANIAGLPFPSSGASEYNKQIGTQSQQTGCSTCHRRKMKCDKAKPECTNCLRGGFICANYQQLNPIPIVALSSEENTMNAPDDDNVDMLNLPDPELNPKKRKRNFTNRTKTGCLTCRRRKMKCDEAKPECTNCLRGGFVCTGYQQRGQWPKTEQKAPVLPQSKTEYENHPRSFFDRFREISTSQGGKSPGGDLYLDPKTPDLLQEQEEPTQDDDEEKREPEDKVKKDEEDEKDNSNPNMAYQKGKWAPVPFVPSATFNTPLPTRGGRGSGGPRGGRAGSGPSRGASSTAYRIPDYGSRCVINAEREEKPRMVQSSPATCSQCINCLRNKVKCVNNGIRSVCNACVESKIKCIYPLSGSTRLPKYPDIPIGMTTEGGKGNDVSELQLSPRDYLAHLHTHPSLARRDRNDLTPPPVPPSMSGYHVCESILVDGLGSIRDVMLKHLGYARGAPSQPTAIACVYCRRRKVRCSGFDQNPEGRCSSCQRFQQECIFVPEQPRSHIPEGVTALTPDLPHSANSRRCKASFDVQWNVKTFMKEQFEDGRKIPIGSVITLTGSALHTQAETVADYLQRHWGSIVLLDALQQSLDFGSSNVSTDYMNEKLDISFQKSPNPAIQEVLVSGSEYGIVSIAQQLAWLGCALRTSTSGQISQSRCLMTWCVYGATGRTSMEYLDEPLDTGEESCWHALFSNPVIACGFPISDRYHDEKGLEIPVRMMAALGGASRAVEFDGGILIKGFSSIFVPLHRTNASIQWHYIRNEDDIRLPYWEVDDRCLGRALLDTVDYEAVNTKRAFLGWWGKTTSHLGTADADYRILDWSDTKEPVRAHRTGDEYFVSQDNLGSKIINFSLGQKDGKLHISRSGPYQRIIKHASRTPVVLYDTRDKRAWLVPSSAVIAHIAQARHHRDPFSINKMTAELTPTDPALTVQEGAERMLLHSSSVLLYNDELTPGVGEYRFRDMVLSIWSLLENLTDRNVIKGTMKEDSVHETLEPTLRGWEFMDLVQERSPIRLKETALRDGHGEWIKLVQDLNATVFFASGFEDLITPDLEAASGLCQKWQHVPKDKDYLTASISILNILYEEAGSRVTKEHLTSTHLRWSRGKNLFEPCSTISKEYTCNRIQQILQESQVVPEAFRSPELLEEAGAVIFGHTDYPTRPTICYRNRSRNDFRYSEANTYTLHDEDLLPTSPWSPDDMNHEGPCVYDMHTWPSKQKSQRPAKSNSSFDEEPLASIERNPKKRSREQGSIYEEPRQLQRQFRYEPMLKDPGCYAHSTPEISGFEEPPKADLPIRVQSNIEQSSAVQSAT